MATPRYYVVHDDYLHRHVAGEPVHAGELQVVMDLYASYQTVSTSIAS